MDLVYYYFYDIWNDYGDPRVTKYPMMDGGPWKAVGAVALYLYITIYLGPQLMKDRKPFDLKKWIFLFNIFLILFNTHNFIRAMVLTNYGLDSWKCKPIDKTSNDPTELILIYYGYLYYVTKLVDFGDTFFFILRKKFDHLSFLHVYHHSSMVIYSWIGLKFVPGGNSGFMPLINSFVHIIMYAYYALSTFPQLKPFLWWKRYLTQLQLIQFVLIIIHSIYSILKPSCSWPSIFIYLSIANGALFFYLFYRFFLKTYKKSSPPNDDKLNNQLEDIKNETFN